MTFAAAPLTVKKGFALFDKRIAVCRAHTCSLSCIFCQVHAPTENDQNPFAACGRQTLRGFFDTLRGCCKMNFAAAPFCAQSVLFWDTA